MKVVVSVVVATFNSRDLLPKVFDSIKKQTFPREEIEVLVVDGGSTDETVEFSLENGCRVINNEEVEPVNAKFLGYKFAKGNYIVFLDHDEVLESSESIARKVNLLRRNDKVKAVLTSGYKTPSGISFINDYINDFGDPFSAFRYWLPKRDGFFIQVMKKKYKPVFENESYVLFKVSDGCDLPIIELVAAGSMIDANYFKSTFPETEKTPSLMPHAFYLMNRDGMELALLKGDAIYHYSSDTFLKYLNKIKWRVKNNIFFDSISSAGYKGRESYEVTLKRYKKFFFLPYSFSILFPLLDSMYLVSTRKNLGYFIHVPLVLYTSSLIVYYGLMKALGYKPVLKSYDEKVYIGDRE